MAKAGGLDVVRIEGLKELQRDLKDAGEKAVSKRLSTKLRKAAQIVADAAKANVPEGPAKDGHASDTIKAGVSGARAFVSGGKASNPYYGWLDFGTREPRATSVPVLSYGGRPLSQSKTGRSILARGTKVGPWRGTGKGPHHGRFIYVAFDEKATQVAALAQDAVDQALKESNL